MRSILIGNSFPFSLIRRDVDIKILSKDDLDLNNVAVNSFWGHQNTVKIASEFLQIDLTPRNKRPILKLNEEFFPVYEKIVYREVFLLSPKCVKIFRPKVGIELKENEIIDWQILKLKWREK